MQPPVARSAIPRVVGIIGVAFATVGLGSSLLFTFGPLHDIVRWRETANLGSVIHWMYLWLALSGVLFCVHLIGSIFAMLYRRIGLQLLTSYAVGAIVLIVIDVVMLVGFVPRTGTHDVWGSLTLPRIIFNALAFPWPVLVLALIYSRRARAACV